MDVSHSDCMMSMVDFSPATVASKYSVVGSLQHRASTICSSEDLLKTEEKHLQEARKRCKYPAWAINKAK